MFLFLWMIVQICLESLPISSSGHTFLLYSYVKKYYETIPLDVLNDFDWALHIITFLVILVFFWDVWWRMILNRSFHVSFIVRSDFWKKLFPACLFVTVATLVFLSLYILIPKSLFQIPLIIGFFLTALELFFMNHLLSSQKHSISVLWNILHAIILGITNSFLVHIPGVSRFGTNFLVCQLLGYKPADAFALSWMVFVPFALAGGVYGMIKVVSNHDLIVQLLHIHILLVMVGAGIISYLLLWYFKYLMNHKKLYYLAWYMILPIAVSLGLILMN